MSIYIVCLLCLLVGGVLGAYMGYRVGFAKGNLHSLYKSAASAVKREEDKFKREIEELRRRVAEREAMTEKERIEE